MFTVSEGEKRRLVLSRNLAENEAFNKETIAFGNEGGFDTKKQQQWKMKRNEFGYPRISKGDIVFCDLEELLKLNEP